MDTSNIDFERILKWVLIVLITGFLAQFGKSFAKYIMDKVRARKPLKRQDQASIDVPQGLTLPPDRDSTGEEKQKAMTDVEAARREGKDEAKLRKKALKAQVKEQKKGKKEAT